MHKITESDNLIAVTYENFNKFLAAIIWQYKRHLAPSSTFKLKGFIVKTLNVYIEKHYAYMIVLVLCYKIMENPMNKLILNSYGDIT